MAAADLTSRLRHVLARIAAFAIALLVAVSAHARTEPVRIDVAGTAFTLDAADGMARFVELASDVVSADWATVAEAAGAPAGESVHVSIERAFEDWFEREGIPSRPPEWAAGLAIPSRRTILLAPGNPTWEATLRHEMAHLAVAIAAGGQPVPAWFNEGFAVATAEQWGLDRATTMITAGITGEFHDFADLDRGFPAAQSMADLAYAQSFHLVRYCRQRFGDDVFRRILARMRTEHVTFSDAFAAETGTLMSVVFDDWARSASTRYRWVPVAGGGGTAWVFVAGLAALAWRRKRRQRAEREAQMQASEAGLYGNDPDDETFG